MYGGCLEVIRYIITGIAKLWSNLPKKTGDKLYEVVRCTETSGTCAEVENKLRNKGAILLKGGGKKSFFEKNKSINEVKKPRYFHNYNKCTAFGNILGKIIGRTFKRYLSNCGEEYLLVLILTSIYDANICDLFGDASYYKSDIIKLPLPPGIHNLGRTCWFSVISQQILRLPFVIKELFQLLEEEDNDNVDSIIIKNFPRTPQFFS